MTSDPLLEPDAERSRHRQEIADVGFTILHDVIPDDLRNELLDTIDRVMSDDAVPFGPNRFLGRNTRRIFNLLSRDPGFARVPLHPPILELTRNVLGSGHLLSSLTAIEMQPGQDAQPLHADTGSIPLARPHQTIVCPAIWALTDFTSENGATRLVPRSQHRDRIPAPGETDDDTIEAVMPAGSALVYDGSVWHGGGANESSSRRVGIVANYCAGWIRQEENQLLALDRDQVAAFPPELRRMVGYGTYRGLIGHVDQVDPATWFEAGDERPMIWDRMR